MEWRTVAQLMKSLATLGSNSGGKPGDWGSRRRSPSHLSLRTSPGRTSLEQAGTAQFAASAASAIGNLFPMQARPWQCEAEQDRWSQVHRLPNLVDRLERQVYCPQRQARALSPNHRTGSAQADQSRQGRSCNDGDFGTCSYKAYCRQAAGLTTEGSAGKVHGRSQATCRESRQANESHRGSHREETDAHGRLGKRMLQDRESAQGSLAGAETLTNYILGVILCIGSLAAQGQANRSAAAAAAANARDTGAGLTMNVATVDGDV
eukprot:5860327-Amphidinium_carterae.1